MTPRIVRTREATSDPLGKRVTQIQGEVIMAVQTSQRASGTRPPPAMRLAVAMLALWAVEVVAQINPPITGSMGGTDARAVAPTQAQSAPVARPQAVPTITTTGAPGAASESAKPGRINPNSSGAGALSGPRKKGCSRHIGRTSVEGSRRLASIHPVSGRFSLARSSGFPVKGIIGQTETKAAFLAR